MCSLILFCLLVKILQLISVPLFLGNLTFPRSAGRRPDNEYMSVRTLMSRGSEGTLSTCSSGSSGLPPDPDMDSPGGAYPSRSSALFTKCEQWGNLSMMLVCMENVNARDKRTCFLYAGY